MTITIAPDNTNLLSQAIITYLGYGTHPSPRKNIRDVEALTLDQGVLAATRSVIRSVLPFDVAGHNDEDTAVADHTRDLHPWLTDDALAAIVWNYFYGWR